MSSSKIIRWGILGCGGIARKFIASSKVIDNAEVCAVAAARPGSAKAFADEQNIEKNYEGYQALLEDPDIDAVYVANTHNFHHETVLLALKANKPVLCEKPLALNAKQAAEMVALARSNGCFLMEGMWSRFLPAIAQAREWIAEGHIGAVKQVIASFGFKLDFPPEHRMVNPDLAGGALLDLGIYPLSFASMIANGETPTSVASVPNMGPTGVDYDNSILLSYPNGVVAHLSSGLSAQLPCTAQIIGEKGTITVPSVFISATSVELKTKVETITRNFPCPDQEGFRYEIEAASQAIIDGEKECSIMPLNETLILASTMDGIRKEWGLVYPGE